MKKQIVFILISAFAAAFTSCNNDDNGRDNVGFSPKSDQQMTVGPEAGTHTIYYDIASPMPHSPYPCRKASVLPVWWFGKWFRRILSLRM